MVYYGKSNLKSRCLSQIVSYPACLLTGKVASISSFRYKSLLVFWPVTSCSAILELQSRMYLANAVQPLLGLTVRCTSSGPRSHLCLAGVGDRTTSGIMCDDKQDRLAHKFSSRRAGVVCNGPKNILTPFRCCVSLERADCLGMLSALHHHPRDHDSEIRSLRAIALQSALKLDLTFTCYTTRCGSRPDYLVVQ